MKSQNQIIFAKIGQEAIKRINGVILSLGASASASISHKFYSDEPAPITVKFYEEVNQCKFKAFAEGEGFTDVEFCDNGSSASMLYPFDYEKVRKSEIVSVQERRLTEAINAGLKGRGYIEDINEDENLVWNITFTGINENEDKHSVFNDVFESIAPIFIVSSWGEYGTRGFWISGNIR